MPKQTRQEMRNEAKAKQKVEALTFYDTSALAKIGKKYNLAPWRIIEIYRETHV